MSFLKGVPHLHPIILPLVPSPFQGGTPVTGHRSFLGSYPSPRWGCPSPRQGVPSPRQGVPQSQVGVHQDGIPLSQVRMGYPPLIRTGWGTPLARTGWGTPWPIQDGVPLSQISYAWTGYAAGGTHLPVSCRRTVLFIVAFWMLKFIQFGLTQHFLTSEYEKLTFIETFSSAFQVY